MSRASAHQCFNPLSCCPRHMAPLFVCYVNKHDFCESKTVQIDDRIWLSCRKSNQELEVMVKGREVIADGDDHHNQPHSILVCVCDCDDDH